MTTAVRVFKVFTADQWDAMQRDGVFEGSADDLRDGYIHMSAEAELTATLEKHFVGQSGLVIAEIASELLGEALKWETARGGALFPHLYAPLRLADVISTEVIKSP
jgi:uncharacterized protein (DUF952 family)